jgi:phosphatidylserine/phosphatidylglycerophosphate/cardiolipin synthase-like enzyme
MSQLRDQTTLRAGLLLAVAGLLTLAGLGCSNQIPESDLQEAAKPKVEVFFNSTGTRPGNEYDLKPSEFLVERLDSAKATIDVAAYGFDKPNVYRALVRAYDRGVKVRFVGDATHIHEDGYQALLDRHIPTQFGNETSIMHNKVFIIDQRFVLTGTGNITPTGFKRNNNHWVWMESQPLAKDFTEEFEQMFSGKFKTAKESTNNKNTYEIGDTTVEVYFSPQEPAMSRMIQEIREVKESLHFQIFAFTKNEVGSAFVNKHRELMAKNEETMSGDWREQSPLTWDHRVTGVLDRSQVHGNGQYHEAYRLQSSGIPMRYDANERSVQPGDYQAGGGRLHTKTMFLDRGTEDARVITGSFNWSSSATVANDEVMLILHGEEITERFWDMFERIWTKSRSLPDGLCNYLKPTYEATGDEVPKCAHQVERGDVVFSEVHWDGWNGQRNPADHTGPLDERESVSNDQFIELYNTTNRPIDLSMWAITTENDFIMGFPPGTMIHPKQHFLVVDHNTEPYSERKPQRVDHAFENADFVLNTANDPRFPRLNFKNTSLYLELRRTGAGPTAPVVDIAGDKGPPFAGGREIECTANCSGGGQADPEYVIRGNYSMERKISDGNVPPGDKASSWKACSRNKGGENVHPDYKDKIIATPGRPNSQ